MGFQRCALVVVVCLVLLHSPCLANIGLSLTGEFPEYTLQEEIVNVVLTVEAPPTVTPPPLSWTAVLDKSGSMRGSKIELLKDTTAFMIERLATPEGTNNLGLVTYSSDVETLATVQPVFPGGVGFLTSVVDTIVALGRTFLSGGLAQGLRQQASAPGGKVKAVYLFTDGLPNVGATSTREIVNEISAILEDSVEPISISTFGFGKDLDIGLLQSIAAVGGGDTYIIGNENDIPFAFGDALGLLLSLSAQDIDVVFTPEPGHEIVSVQAGGKITFLPDGSVRIVFDNLSAGEVRDILIEVRVPPVVSVVQGQNIFTVENTYIDAPTMERVTIDPIPYTIQRTTTTRTPVPPAPKVEETKIRFKAAEVLGEAIKKKDEGDTEGANAVLAALVAETEGSPLVDDPVIQNIITDVTTAQEILGGTTTEEEPQADLQVAQLEQTFRTQRTTANLGRGRFRSTRALDTPFRREVREEAAMAVLGPLPPPPPIAEPPTTAPEPPVPEPPTAAPPPPVAQSPTVAPEPPVAESPTVAPEPPVAEPLTGAPPPPVAEPPAAAPPPPPAVVISLLSPTTPSPPPPVMPSPPPPVTPSPPPPVTPSPPPPETPSPPPPVTPSPPLPATPSPPPPATPSPPPPATPSPPPPLTEITRGRISLGEFGSVPNPVVITPTATPDPLPTSTAPALEPAVVTPAPIAGNEGPASVVPGALSGLEERRQSLRQEAEAEAARRVGGEAGMTDGSAAVVDAVDAEVAAIGTETEELAQPPMQAPPLMDFSRSRIGIRGRK